MFGTKVKNPCHRSGTQAFVPCTYCGLYFTKLGISRHWDKCKMKKAKK